jgi:hypothetical protein
VQGDKGFLPLAKPEGEMVVCIGSDPLPQKARRPPC